MVARARPSAQRRASSTGAEGTARGRTRAEGIATKRTRAAEIVRRLAVEYPGSARTLCALRHRGAFQLLVATILSAQCTDAKVNEVTPRLFATWPGPAELAAANPGQLEELIRPTGFFRVKARSLQGMSAALVERFGGVVPRDLQDLVTLPGVGRKTGNVVRSVAWGLPGLPVDTHVGRVARRLGLSSAQDPDQVERDVSSLVLPEDQGPLSLRLILHGRRVCTARSPRCERCVLEDLCPSSTLRGAVSRPAPSRRR